MALLSPFRIRLWDIGASRGRGNSVATIDDASDIGVSAYANEGGEMFFTLPMNHPQISEISPWLRHYEVSRLNAGVYEPVGVGLIDDYEASEDEVIVYGRDYLSLFNVSISAASTTYTNATYTSIITAQLSAAIFGGGSTASVTRFITLGTISSVADTTTVLTAFQPRLEFIRQLGEVLASDDSTRPIIKVTRTSPFTVTWGANVGSDQTNRRLQYGGNVNGFRFNPGFSDFATSGWGIGQKREGATVLYSGQTYASEVTYGSIQRATVFIDIINQAALDRRVRRFARDLGSTNKNLSLRLRSGALSPADIELADSLPVIIDRGFVQLNALFTCWGWEWIGKKDGSEDLFLDLLPKRT